MSRQSGQQVLLIAASLGAWSVAGVPSLLALLVAYVCVWLGWQWRPLRRNIASFETRQLLVMSVLLALPGLAFGYRMRARIVEREQWSGLTTHLVDRLRLETSPAIAPGLVSGDQPQTFFVHAPAARSVRVRFGAKCRELAAEALGFELFRVEYDPRRDCPLEPTEGDVSVRISTNRGSVERKLRAVTPLVHPRWFCDSPEGTWAATPSEETDELVVVGSEGRVSRIAVGDGPVDCAFPDEQTVIVSHRYAGRLASYDIASGRPIKTLALQGRLGRMAIDPGASRLAVASDGRAPALLIVNWPELSVRARVQLSAAADWLAFGRDATTLVITTRADATLRLFAEQADDYTQTLAKRLGRPAVSLGRSRDGTRIWIATTDYRPDATPQLGNHFVQDQLLTFETASLALLERRLTARRSERQSKPGDVDQGGSPMGITEQRDGALAVTFAGTDELWRWASATAEPEIFDLSESELRAPHGVVELRDGTLWLSSPSSAALGLLLPGSTRLQVVPLASSDAALKKQNPHAYARRLGERGFYESTRAGIACQSCHSHSDSDAARYNLGDHRVIPTLSVRGLIGTAPYLRDGSYPRLRDLDFVAQERYRGYLRKQPGRPVALEAYLEALPRLQPLAAERDPAAERRGLGVFAKAHCGRCHALPAFTNLALLPMLALFPKHAATLPGVEMLDVPSLLSVGTSAPYLSDGRASNLLAVLRDQNRDNLHGDTRKLSESELRDLVVFLGSL